MNEEGEDDVSVDVVACFQCDCSSLPEKYRQQISEVRLKFSYTKKN